MNKYIKLLTAINFLLMTQVSFAEVTYRTEPTQNTTSVSFADSSTRFKPGLISKSILDSSSSASMIIINGRTSTKTPSKKDEMLALARAVSARDYLVNNYGVSPLKIMINYLSAGDFISENITKRGKYLNQRVDIKLIYVPAY